MADSRPVSPGDPIGQLPSFSASWLNNVSRMLRWFNRNVASGESSGGSSGLENGTGPVRVKNLTGSDLLRGNYVQLGDYLLDSVNHRQHWYKGNLYDSGTDGRIAILTKAVKTAAGSTVEARILGRCTARVNVTDITHRFAVPADGAYLFVSAAAAGIGAIEILSTNLIVGTGEQEVAVVMGGGGGGSVSVTAYRVVKDVPAATGHLQSNWGHTAAALSPLAEDGTEIFPGHEDENMVDAENQMDDSIPIDAKAWYVGTLLLFTCHPFIDWDDVT